MPSFTTPDTKIAVDVKRFNYWIKAELMYYNLSWEVVDATITTKVAASTTAFAFHSDTPYPSY